MPSDAATRNILVHHPAAHADEIIFGPLTELGDFDRIELQAAFGEQRMRARDFERGRGAQARSDRDIAPDDEIGAGKGAPAPLQHERDPEDVVRPVAGWAWRRRIEVELARLVHDHGIDSEAPVGPLRGRGQRGEFERRRHDEAIVVVGMLADQIDAAWRATDRRYATEPIGELDRKVARLNAHLKPSRRGRTGGPAGPWVKRV